MGGVSSAWSSENSDVFPGSVAVAETIAFRGRDVLRKVNEALPSIVVVTATLPRSLALAKPALTLDCVGVKIDIRPWCSAW